MLITKKTYSIISLLIPFLFLMHSGCRFGRKNAPISAPATPQTNDSNENANISNLESLFKLTDKTAKVASPYKCTPLSVTDEAGNIATVVIPPKAFDESQAVTLHATKLVINETFDGTNLMGIEFQPAGKKLNCPSLVRLKLTQSNDSFSQIRLYQMTSAGKIRPLTRQTIGESTIEGYLYSTDPCFAGIATSATLLSLAANYAGDTVFDNADEMQQRVEEMIELGSGLKQFGRDTDGQSLIDRAWNIVMNDLNTILNQPIPDRPCQDYLDSLMKYAGVISSFKKSNNVTNSLGARIRDVLNKCPIKGYLTYYLYTIPYLINFYAEGHIPFYTSDIGFIGESQNNLVIDSPVLTEEDMSIWFDGNGQAKYSISGSMDNTSFLELKLKMKVVCDASYLRLDFFGEIPERGLIHAIHLECEDNVNSIQFDLSPLREPFIWLKGPCDTRTYDLTFYYHNGAQTILTSGDTDLEAVEVWTLNIELEPATVFITGIKPLTMKSVIDINDSPAVTLGAYGNPPGGAYQWSIISGSDKVNVIGNTTGQFLTLRPVSESASKNDIEVSVEYKTSEGEARYNANLTSHKPGSVRLLSKNTEFINRANESGYTTTRLYMVLDQFGERFPLGKLFMDEDLIPIYNPYNTDFREKTTWTDEYSIYPDGYTLLWPGREGVPHDYEAQVRQKVRADGYQVLDHVLVWKWDGVRRP